MEKFYDYAFSVEPRSLLLTLARSNVVEIEKIQFVREYIQNSIPLDVLYRDPESNSGQFSKNTLRLSFWLAWTKLCFDWLTPTNRNLIENASKPLVLLQVAVKIDWQKFLVKLWNILKLKSLKKQKLKRFKKNWKSSSTRITGIFPSYQISIISYCIDWDFYWVSILYCFEFISSFFASTIWAKFWSSNLVRLFSINIHVSITTNAARD